MSVSQPVSQPLIGLVVTCGHLILPILSQYANHSLLCREEWDEISGIERDFENNVIPEKIIIIN